MPSPPILFPTSPMIFRRRQLILVALFVSTASSLPFIGSVQSVRVTGKVTCNGEPAENIKVKLYEKEIRKFLKTYPSFEKAN